MSGTHERGPQFHRDNDYADVITLIDTIGAYPAGTSIVDVLTAIEALVSAHEGAPPSVKLFTADAYLRRVIFFVDSVIKRSQSGSFTSNAVLNQAIRLNAVLRRTLSSSFTANAVVSIGIFGFTEDAVIRRNMAGNLLADGILRRAQTASFTEDSILRKAQSSTFTGDAVLAAATDAFQHDAFQNDAFQMDAHAFRADAVLRRTQSGSFTENAIVRRAGSGTFTADAVVQAAFTIDAVIAGGGFQSNAFQSDAFQE